MHGKARVLAGEGARDEDVVVRAADREGDADKGVGAAEAVRGGAGLEVDDDARGRGRIIGAVEAPSPDQDVVALATLENVADFEAGVEIAVALEGVLAVAAREEPGRVRKLRHRRADVVVEAVAGDEDGAGSGEAQVVDHDAEAQDDEAAEGEVAAHRQAVDVDDARGHAGKARRDDDQIARHGGVETLLQLARGRDGVSGHPRSAFLRRRGRRVQVQPRRLSIVLTFER